MYTHAPPPPPLPTHALMYIPGLFRYLAELGYPDYVLETRVSRLRAQKNSGLQAMPPDANGSDEGAESPGSKPPPPPRADSLGKLVSICLCVMLYLGSRSTGRGVELRGVERGTDSLT